MMADDLPTVLAPGDPIRGQARRSLIVGAMTGVAFVLFAYVTTQLHGIRAESPWQNDPYDVVVSFTMFYVPALLLLGLVRAHLCRRFEALPVSRVRGLLRAAKVVLVLVGVTLLTDWVAVAMRADQTSWGSATPVLVLGLGLLSLLVALSAHRVRAVGRELTRQGLPVAASDWAAEVVPVAALASQILPVASRPLRWVAEAIETHVVAGRFGVRRQPFLATAACAIGAGLVVSSALAFREGGFGSLFLYDLGVFASTTFGFLVVANRSLQLAAVHTSERLAVRSVWVATTAAALAIPVTLGFRDLIWRGLGLGWEVQTLGQLVVLLTVSFAGVWAVSFMVALVLHPRFDERSAA